MCGGAFLFLFFFEQKSLLEASHRLTYNNGVKMKYKVIKETEQELVTKLWEGYKDA
jgi:hypothetical protein